MHRFLNHVLKKNSVDSSLLGAATPQKIEEGRNVVQLPVSDDAFTSPINWNTSTLNQHPQKHVNYHRWFFHLFEGCRLHSQFPDRRITTSFPGAEHRALIADVNFKPRWSPGAVPLTRLPLPALRFIYGNPQIPKHAEKLKNQLSNMWDDRIKKQS